MGFISLKKEIVPMSRKDLMLILFLERILKGVISEILISLLQIKRKKPRGSSQ